MRALGTDPVLKLVKPRLIATAVLLPLLTILADFIGMIGGLAGLLRPAEPHYQRALLEHGVAHPRIQRSRAGASLKPFVFAIVIALVGCFYGMETKGGTQGVGLATTRAVVVSSVWIVVLTFIIGRVFVSL